MKTIYKYEFKLNKIPSRLTMHSLFRWFTDGKEVDNFKIYSDGYIITIISDFNFDGNFNLELKDQNGKCINVDLIKKSEFKDEKKVKNGDVVKIMGVADIAIKNTKTGVIKCPFFKGKFESLELRNKFKEKIENAFGVKVIEMRNTSFNRRPIEILSKKIRLNNLIDFSLSVEVVDAELFNKINYKSYFKKKTYGLGNFYYE